MNDEPQEPKKIPLPHPYYLLASKIIDGFGGGDYIYSLEEGYIYVYENGCWKRLFDIEFLDRVESKIHELKIYPLSVKKGIVEQFKYKKYKHIEEFNKHTLINLENYMIDAIGQNVLSHDKKYYSTNRIPYKYDNLAKCELWEKTLNEILENDGKKKNLLQEFFGYCLVPDMTQKKALLLLGETDTGKSTILFILKDLLGQMNCSSVPLQYLPNPQYTPLLMNKMVNIDADVNKNAADFEREFKTITSGEPVSCNQKHIPTFEFIPKCKIVLAANIFPRITDHSSAFYQRLMIVPCMRRFSEKEKNRNLHGELKGELSGIFNWALEGLKRLKTRGMFESHDFMSDAVEELQEESNPTHVFFKEHIVAELETEIEKGYLYSRYIEWCKKEQPDGYILSAARFSAAVYQKYCKFTPKNSFGNTSRKRIWRNLKYIDDKEVQHEEVQGWQE